MRVRWTTEAADDLERICDYIAESRPESARRVARSVIDRIGTLETFPHIGRPGRIHGTREIAFPPFPFVAVYEVFEVRDEVQVLRVLHGAQQWPAR
jgi:addiction module RelE/StbE family toxin